MKTILLSGLFFGLCITANAQTSGWETGVNASVGISDQFYTSVPAPLKNGYKQFQKFFAPDLAYSAGFFGRKFFKDSYGLEFGVQYTSLSQATKEAEAIDETGSTIGTRRSNVRYNFVEIPLRFVFKKDLGNVFGIGCFAGLAPAFLTHARQRNIIDPTEGDRLVQREDQASATRFNLFADVGLLFRVNVCPRFALDLKPFARLALFNSQNGPWAKSDYAPAQKRFYTGGLSVSAVWKM